MHRAPKEEPARVRLRDKLRRRGSPEEPPVVGCPNCGFRFVVLREEPEPRFELGPSDQVPPEMRPYLP